MLSQIESGKTTPTIAVLWKIAEGLGLPFSALLGSEQRDPVVVTRESEAETITSADGQLRSRPLFLPGPDRRVEFYELTVRAGGRSRSRPHAPATTEILAVRSGRLRLEVGGRAYDLGPGDTIEFPADVEHSYANPGRASAVAYDVIIYA